jgi:glycosyltransferase involved in cell wall biosynthesis
MKIAFVYDRVNKWGGAERVLLALHKIWPDAPLYTAVYDPHKATWARVFEVRPSFLSKLPWARRSHELFPWLTPMAFESFSFDKFDVVISVTSAEAKNIITKPGTIHICYCLTPTRYLWSGFTQYLNSPGLGPWSGIGKWALGRMVHVLRRWDLVAAKRPDMYVAISDAVKDRIYSYYGQKATVIYPPVYVNKFSNKKSKGYFLVVSRLVGYKRVDLLIDAFNSLGWPLIVVGTGRDKNRLMRKAKDNISFKGNVSERELIALYGECRAFVYAGEEDFGIVACEAQAAGKPVIAYKKGGIGEIVIPGVTGELFDYQTKESLIDALQRFESGWYDNALCRKNAMRFSEAEFIQKVKVMTDSVYNKKRI